VQGVILITVTELKRLTKNLLRTKIADKYQARAERFRQKATGKTRINL
jgi:hypothetical protein